MGGWPKVCTADSDCTTNLGKDTKCSCGISMEGKMSCKGTTFDRTNTLDVYASAFSKDFSNCYYYELASKYSSSCYVLSISTTNLEEYLPG